MTDGVLIDDDGAFAALAYQVIDDNRQHGRCVALAESCTGGLVSSALTDIAGSSDVFLASFVTYADEAKMSALGVSREIIETFGAVSPACAWAMARGALERTGADVAVSISGIAGPGGGTEQKPVGTVVFSRVLKGHVAEQAHTVLMHFGTDGGRAAIRRRAALFALELLLPSADALHRAP